MSYLHDRLKRAKRLRARHAHRYAQHPGALRERHATRHSLAGRETAAAARLARAEL
jgi:hypothetical protein